VEANQQLLACDSFLTMGARGNGLSVYSDDDEVRSFATLKADRFKRRFFEAVDQMRSTERKNHRAIKVCEKELGEYGLEFPLKKWRKATVEQVCQAWARIFDPQWWRRRVRRRQEILIETMNIRLGVVNLNRGLYASDMMVSRKRAQRRNNEQLMRVIELENDLGEVYSLFDLNQTSVSNPVHRRCELMTRSAGFQEIADERGDAGMMVTITAPSKYHAFKRKPCVPNPKYGGYTPKDTQIQLNMVWSRIRTALNRKGLNIYGFRVVEPNHDGTPHWHILLFCVPNNKAQIVEIIKRYALEEDGDESGAQEHRVNVVDIDSEKGTAAGYIAKYISKGIDGHGINEDLYGHDAASSADRIKAWASTWGIRQFQQIGGVSVTVYRELRRLNGVVPKSVKLALDDPEQFAALVEAADQGDWHAFTNLMGGVNAKRKDQLLRACYMIKEQCGKYQETTSKLIGVLVEGVKTVITRIRKWTVRGINRAVNMSMNESEVLLTEGSDDPTWSSVNKCTDSEGFS